MSAPRQSSVLERLSVDECEPRNDHRAESRGRKRQSHKSRIDTLARKARASRLDKNLTEPPSKATASRIVTPVNSRRKSRRICESSDEEVKTTAKPFSIPEESDSNDNMSDEEHSDADTVFTQLETPRKCGSVTTKYKTIGGDKTCTDHQFAKRALKHFLTDRPEGNKCCKMQKGGGFSFTNCTCAMDFTSGIRKEHLRLATELGGDEAARTQATRRMKRKWIPIFEEMSRILRPMWEDSNSSEGVFSLMSTALPFNCRGKQNTAPKYIFKIGDEVLHFCFGGMVEITGAQYLYSDMVEFQSNFLSGRNGKWKDEKSRHFYLHGYALRNRQRVTTWGALADIFIENEAFIEEQNLVARNVLVRLGEMHARFSEDDIEQNFQVFRTKLYRPVINIVKALAEDSDRLIIAHPNMHRFPTILPTGDKEEKGKVTHVLIGLRSYLDIAHRANAGTIEVEVREGLFASIGKSVDRLAGHSGLQTRPKNSTNGVPVLSPVDLCEHLRFYSTPPILDDSIPHLLHYLEYDDDKIADLASVSGAFMDRCFQVCRSLLPPEDQTKAYSLASISGVMKTTPHKNDLTGGKVFIQASHTDFSRNFLKDMKAEGIHAFTSNLPLSEEGVFLRVNRSVQEELPDTLPGQLVYVPQQSMFFHPASMVHAGAFRSGPRGNLRMHFVFFLIPTTNGGDPLAKLPTEFTQEYLGIGDNDRHDVPLYDHRCQTDADPEARMAELRASRPQSPLYDLSWMEDFAANFSV